ncbi:MAG: hypothetical protein HOL01_19105 [Planctomycetaceae bacterium]|jgi:DNA-directed RNA polymerase specialized sigma24 family protein|nr:hypothetical protein [Planctomycetaceae bacterium]MBT6484321.1 hypothetical protein [Planctomycetaceae bacterium]MBT6496649.1 hypothetical protein [Planctomycetaceae bacterium]
MTKRKAASHIRRESAQKRGGTTRPKSLSNDDSSGYSFEELVSQDLSCESLLIFGEEYSRLLSLLRDDRLRQIAVLKVEGYVSREIAERLGVAVSTVTRKLRLIRSVWARELEQ